MTLKYDYRYQPADEEAYRALMDSIEPTGYTSPIKADKPRHSDGRFRGTVIMTKDRYGFIRTDKQKVFFHFDEIVGDKKPNKGSTVTYRTGKDVKGRPAAVSVKVER